MLIEYKERLWQRKLVYLHSTAYAILGEIYIPLTGTVSCLEASFCIGRRNVGQRNLLQQHVLSDCPPSVGCHHAPQSCLPPPSPLPCLSTSFAHPSPCRSCCGQLSSLPAGRPCCSTPWSGTCRTCAQACRNCRSWESGSQAVLVCQALEIGDNISVLTVIYRF